MGTAEFIATEFGLTVRTDPRLRESNLGHWQGRTWDDICTNLDHEQRAWRGGDGRFAMEGGESVRARFARVAQACHSIALAHPGQSVVVVLHGGILGDIDRMVSQIPFGKNGERRAKVNAGISVIDFEPSEETAAVQREGESASAYFAKRISEVYDASVVDASTAATVFGSWKLVQWGITAHLQLSGLSFASHKTIQVSDIIPQSAAADSTGTAETVATAATEEDEVAPAAASDAETQAVG